MAIKAKGAGYQQDIKTRNPQQVGSHGRNSLGKGEVESSILSCSTSCSGAASGLPPRFQREQQQRRRDDHRADKEHGVQNKMQIRDPQR
jgi:hypothetical protein